MIELLSLFRVISYYLLSSNNLVRRVLQYLLYDLPALLERSLQQSLTFMAHDIKHVDLDGKLLRHLIYIILPLDTLRDALERKILLGLGIITDSFSVKDIIISLDILLCVYDHFWETRCHFL